MKTILETRNLRKWYPMDGSGVEALRGVSMKVETGEFVAVMGPSGSGKSTLLHLLGVMDTPSEGEVRLGGLDLARMNEAARTQLRRDRIGFVFQTFNLLPTLTAQENVEIAMRLAGVRRAERRMRAAKLLERMGLGGRAGHLPRQLSGGERQRVAVARALANRPVLLLADEPTGNLDSATGISIVRLMRELNGEGQTIVMVTHNPEVAAQAGRILHMKDGQLQQIPVRR